MKNNAADLFETLLKDKNLGLSIGNDAALEYDRISFGIPQLDKITNGGIPKKRFTLIYGGWSSGKSYLCTKLSETVQKDNGTVLWVDTEQSWDSDWMTACGLDTNRILLKVPENAEDAYNAMAAGMKNGVDLVVLDSVAGLIPSEILKQKDMFSYSPMAWQSRSWNQALIRLLPLLRHGSALVVINQVRGSMGPVAAIETMPGGKGQQFFAHGVLETRRGEYIKDPKGKRLGFNIITSLQKDKFGGTRWEQVETPFRVEGGIDITETYLREALELGLINKSGAWYTSEFFGEETIQGFDNLRLVAAANPDNMQRLVSAIQKRD